MQKGNAVYAQSGGVTSVINASAYGVIKRAFKTDCIENVYGALYGINGILEENLLDLQEEEPITLESLRYTPGAAFGSCRHKLPDLEKNRVEFERIVQVCEAHNIRYFFYNGGNDSMDTVAKISQISQQMGYELSCIGIPKTVDNDLPETDNCPGYGSAAKYNAISILEAGFDLLSMCRDSTKVFVMETMGRHTGWIAASTALARSIEGDPPHIILVPERPVEEDPLLARVDETIAQYGYCVIAVSEGIRTKEGKFWADAGYTDNFGNTQLGGVGALLQNMIKQRLGFRTHGALLDYCQRSARHIASRVDIEQAIACGKHAVTLSQEGWNGQMVTIVRESNDPYRWSLSHVDATSVASQERPLPDVYLNDDGFGVTEEFLNYCRPLIEGQDSPSYQKGIPQYARLQKYFLPKQLPEFLPSS